MSRPPAVSREPAVSRPAVSRGTSMITKGFPPLSAVKGFAIMHGTTAGLGLLTVAWPLAWAPGWAYVVAVLGAAAVLAGAFARWPPGPALAVAAAILACAFSRTGTGGDAAEGLFILAYLVAADAPAGLSPTARPWSWLRQQAPAGVAGLVASGAVLAALTLHQASSAVLTAAGLAAAVGAYLIALPRTRRGSDVDVQ